MEMIFSVIAVVISLIALISDRVSLHDQAYDKFSQLWFGMDQLFIDYPHMHKYFYYNENKQYSSIDKDNKDYQLAICIAERFLDVFQYTDPLEKYLKKADRESYKQYKAMVLGSPAVIEAKKNLSWSELWSSDPKPKHEDLG